MDHITQCEVCHKADAVGVGALPGVPLSVAFCQRCLSANVCPWWVAVAQTALIGGLDHARPEWIEMVENTIEHLGMTRIEFDKAVTEITQMIKNPDSQGGEEEKRK